MDSPSLIGTCLFLALESKQQFRKLNLANILNTFSRTIGFWKRDVLIRVVSRRWANVDIRYPLCLCKYLLRSVEVATNNMQTDNFRCTSTVVYCFGCVLEEEGEEV